MGGLFRCHRGGRLDMPESKSIRLNGEQWNLTFADLEDHPNDGYCDDPKTKRRRIWVHEGLKNRRELEVLIHEMLHAVDWHKDEDSFIKPVARDIAKVLWSLGFRRSVVDGDKQSRSKAE